MDPFFNRAFSADLFGTGVRPTEVKDKRQHTGELYKDREKMRTLLRGALETAKSKGGNVHHAVAMGYCFGGAAVLELARSGADFKGFVTFHGGLSTPPGQDYSKTKGRLLILHGTADANITMDIFAKLAIAFEEKGVSHERKRLQRSRAGGGPITQRVASRSWKATATLHFSRADLVKSFAEERKFAGIIRIGYPATIQAAVCAVYIGPLLVDNCIHGKWKGVRLC